MEADDLRIGNWVKDIKKGYVSIHGIEPNWEEVWLNYCHGSGIYKKRIIEIRPIPLTEELLKKCGFQQRPIRNDSYSLCLQEFCIYRNEDTCHFELPNEYGGTGSYVEIKSLHQLQNLYFALTGEELEINLSDEDDRYFTKF